MWVTALCYVGMNACAGQQSVQGLDRRPTLCCSLGTGRVGALPRGCLQVTPVLGWHPGAHSPACPLPDPAQLCLALKALQCRN